MNTRTTKNILHKNNWDAGVVHFHVEPPPTPLRKSKHSDKLENDFVKIKLRRDPRSERSNLYEFKIALFDNGDLEEFLLFICNSNVTSF